MTRFVGILSVALVVLSVRGVSAQETLTLQGALQETLARNASLRSARSASAGDAARVTEARSQWFPTISVSESWQRGDQPVFVFSSLLSARRFAAANFAIDALTHPAPIGFFRTSLGMEQTLFDGGQRRSQVDAAALRRDMSGLAVDEAAAGLALSVTETFGRILIAEARQHTAEAGLQAAREDLARAEHRRDAGLANDADVLALDAHAADLQQRVIDAQADAATARAEMNRLRGAPIDRGFAVAEPSDLRTVADAGQSLDALLAEADASRPELRRAAAAQRLAEAGLKQARAALIPEVAAQAAVDVSGTRIADRASAWLVGGAVRWNLSLGGAERAHIKAALETRAQAAAAAEDARAAVHVEVATALHRLEAGRARQAVSRAAADHARETQRIVRNRFDAGVAGVTDVLRASTAVLDAEAQRVSAIVDAIVGEAMLRRAVGRHP